MHIISVYSLYVIRDTHKNHFFFNISSKENEYDKRSRNHLILIQIREGSWNTNRRDNPFIRCACGILLITTLVKINATGHQGDFPYQTISPYV